MEPSAYIQRRVIEVCNENKHDVLSCCLAVERELFQEIAAQLTNPELSFEEKFQLSADLAYASDCLETLIDAAQLAVYGIDDPFYLILHMLEEK